MSAVMEKPSPPQHRKADTGQVNTRLAVLEARWEAVVPTLATKSDLERSLGELRVELHKMDARISRWMLATIVALFVGFAGMFFALQRNLDHAVSRIEHLSLPLHTTMPGTPLRPDAPVQD